MKDSTMKALILLDLDNLVGLRRRLSDPENSFRPQAFLFRREKEQVLFDDYQEGYEAACWPPYPNEDWGAIVALALNQSTMRTQLTSPGGRPPWSLHLRYLSQLAASAARAVGVKGDILCELAFCLTAPESADAALLHLLERAPAPSHCGPFTDIFLFSNDADLARQLSQIVDFPRKKFKPAHLQLYKSTLARRGEIYQRQPPPTPVAEKSPAAMPCGYSVPVTTPEEIKFVSRRSTEVALSTTTGEQASRKVEQRPHTLSQISVTRTTTRGVCRARPGNSGSTVQIGECSTDDGLFVSNGSASEPEVEVTRAEAASIGIGAVHLPEVPLTLRTRLPLGAYQKALQQHGPWTVRGGRPNYKDTNLLGALPPLKNIGRRVVLEVRQDHFVSERQIIPAPKVRCKSSTDHFPDAWWYRKRQARSCFSPTPPGEHFQHRCDFRWKKIGAYMQRLGHQLVFALDERELPARLDHPVDPWQLAVGQGEEGLLLVLALGGALPAGSHQVRPIQQLHTTWLTGLDAPWDADYWEELRRLPLGLALCQIPGSCCLCTSRGER